MTPEERVMLWVDEAIIGLDLCPFARSVRGQMRVAMRPESDLDAAIEATLAEVRTLLDDPTNATSLVVFEAGLQAFESFLDVVDVVADALEQSGADSYVQLATFHPAYQFEGTAPGDLSNHTNRAPYPIIHLLRTDAVGDAVDKHPDTLAIPEANMARLAALGTDEVAKRWARFMPDAPA
ncbi:MAG: hypothetical protein ACI9MR_000829 [Myxococcota bacterium]|jgi:hypothetical protein